MRSKAALMMILMFLLASAVPANAWVCPEAGSGYDGVAGFIEGCTTCDENPATTCNDEFSIKFLGLERTDSLVTISYEVCNLNSIIAAGFVYGFDYIVVGLGQLEDCLGEGVDLSDLLVSCEGVEDCYFVENDEKTQLTGVKLFFDLSDGECKTISFTLDESLLAEDFEIGVGCIVAATVSGYQDITCYDCESPGYACVQGPVCKEKVVPPEEEFICPKTQGFWKNHKECWPVETLVLGDETYSQSELLALLRKPVRGDASLILAKQLIAAKLNIAAGSDPEPIMDIINEADELLAEFSGKLPYCVRPSSSAGKEMVELAEMLDEYNEGFLTSECKPSTPCEKNGDDENNCKGWKGKCKDKDKHNGRGRWWND